MRDEELRQGLSSLAGPVAQGVEPPDPQKIRERGRRRRRRLLGGTVLAVVVALAAGAGVEAGLAGRREPSPITIGPAGSGPAPPTTLQAPPSSGPGVSPTAPPSTGAAPATTLPLGKVEQLHAIQFIGGTGTGWAVGKGAILATSDGGRTWGRVWSGSSTLRDVDFSSSSSGWALGDGVLLGTVDRGQHWRALGQPRSGPLRRVHFSGRGEGWGVAGGSDQAGEGPMLPQGATTLVHTSDGGRTWAVLASPAPPQSVCFTARGDGWLASGASVWRSTDGGLSWGRRPSFTLPVPAGGPGYLAELQCAAPGAAWVRFSGGGAAAGHVPYALYASGDGGAHWRGVLAEPGTLGQVLRLPAGPGSYPGPFSVIDPGRAFVLSPTPPAGTVGAAMVSGLQVRRLPDIPGASLLTPLSASFASATRGWVVGSDAAGHAVILATTDGGRSWRSQLVS